MIFPTFNLGFETVAILASFHATNQQVALVTIIGELHNVTDFMWKIIGSFCRIRQFLGTIVYQI